MFIPTAPKSNLSKAMKKIMKFGHRDDSQNVLDENGNITSKHNVNLLPQQKDAANAHAASLGSHGDTPIGNRPSPLFSKAQMK